MANAALAPRVRMFAICDDVSASETEDGVFNLEAVRQRLYADSFPWRAELSVFLVLSNPRTGRYPGRIRIVLDRADKTVRYVKFLATFQDDDLLPLYVDLGYCLFPEPGQYTFKVEFSSPSGGETLKGEYPFPVLQHEE